MMPKYSNNDSRSQWTHLCELVNPGSLTTGSSLESLSDDQKPQNNNNTCSTYSTPEDPGVWVWMVFFFLDSWTNILPKKPLIHPISTFFVALESLWASSGRQTKLHWFHTFVIFQICWSTYDTRLSLHLRPITTSASICRLRLEVLSHQSSNKTMRREEVKTNITNILLLN